MPWTLSHPAAVLPFRRLCPKYLSFPALVAGSVAPDMPYHADRFDIGSLAHTFTGSFLICLPIGLLLLLIFHALRRPLWFLLPQPHRGALQPLVATRPSWNAQTLLAAAASIILGAWTHSIWDSFTHGGTWMVDRIGLLSQTWLQVGRIAVPGYTVLQDLSTLLGAVALGIAYFAWLRRQRRTLVADAGNDRWRYLALAGGAAASVGVALALALAAPTDVHETQLRMLLVRIAIYAVSSFALLLAAYSALYFALRSRM